MKRTTGRTGQVLTQSRTVLLELVSGRSVHLQRLHKRAFTEPPAKLQELVTNKGLYSTKWCIADHYAVSPSPALTRADGKTSWSTSSNLQVEFKRSAIFCIIVWLCWWRQLKKAAHRRHWVTTGSVPECFFLLLFFCLWSWCREETRAQKPCFPLGCHSPDSKQPVQFKKKVFAKWMFDLLHKVKAAWRSS